MHLKKTEKKPITFLNIPCVGDLRAKKTCVCVLEIVDEIQGDEQVNDGQMIEGRINPEQLCCRFK